MVFPPVGNLEMVPHFSAGTCWITACDRISQTEMTGVLACCDIRHRLFHANALGNLRLGQKLAHSIEHRVVTRSGERTMKIERNF